MSRPTSEAPRAFTVERRLPVAPDAIADARRAIDELVGILDDDVVDSARLLISELVTNAVRHGPHGGADAIVLSVDHDGGRLRVEVRDDGDGFVLPARGDRDVGGWGLVLVEQLSDRWRIETGSPTRVWFEIDTDPAAGRWSSTIDSLLLEIERAAVIATDLDGVVKRWNRHATELYGYEAREAIGRNVVELIVRAGDERSLRSIESRLRTGEAWEGEWLAARRDGSSVWVRVATSPVVDLSGDMLGMLAVSVDVTERRTAQRALVESEERLRIALESGRMGTWDWDVASGRVTWSESLERIHGLEPGSFGGTFEDLQRDLHPEDRARVLGSIERALHDGASYVLDHRITVPGGGVRWLSVHGRVLRDDDGRPTAMVGVASDITERKEAERALAVQYSVSRALATATTLASATTPLLRGVGEELGWEVGGIWRVDADGRALRFVGGWQFDDAVGARIVAASQTLRLERGRGLPGRILATGRPLWLDDFSERTRFPR
ncbi:MAG TPA: PAS domain S-box protein, partial [Actinomycetota bacterium]|nr:PAS domain S-box protein [Actinomycetota bacterium]